MISPKGFEAVVRNNLLGAFNVCHAVANRAMLPRGRGRVVNIIANVFRGFPGMAHTGAARAGGREPHAHPRRRVGTRGGHRERRGARHDPFDGDRSLPPELLAKAERATPLGRLGTPNEVAHLATFLSLDASAYITGSVFYIDGGASLWGDIWEYGEE